jgi:hypothetical protein
LDGLKGWADGGGSRSYVNGWLDGDDDVGGQAAEEYPPFGVECSSVTGSDGLVEWS